MPPPTPRPYSELHDAMVHASGQTRLCGHTSSPPLLLQSTAGDRAMGVISIPEMDVELPIYLGVTDDNMAVGTVHLSKTSLPVGGLDTNCVIVTHRGLRSTRYIDHLEMDDKVHILNL